MTQRTTIAAFIAAVAMAAFAQTPVSQSAASPAAVSPDQSVAAAQNAFDEAVRLAHTDSATAQVRYRDAAGHYLRLIESGHRNAAIEYNLGNIYHRLGETGRAILHYRRAQELEPGSARVAANLDYVRKRVTPLVSPSGETRLVSRLLFWNEFFSPRARFTFAVVLLSAGWALLAVRLFIRRRPIAVAGVLAIVVGFANAASVAWQLSEARARPPVVIVQDGVKLCRERNDESNPVLREALGRGVEAVILHERGGWFEVSLRDGTTGWVPASAVERV